MIIKDLYDDTHSDYEHLRELMFVDNILDGTLTLHQYKQILTTNYIIHYTFEDYLYSGLNQRMAQQLDVEHRRKLGLILTDIHELKLHVPLMDNYHIHLNESTSFILGAMYVMELDTLVNNVLRRKLKENPNLKPQKLSFMYYQAYGSEVIKYWDSFCRVLNARPHKEYKDVLLGAKTLFECAALTQSDIKTIFNKYR